MKSVLTLLAASLPLVICCNQTPPVQQVQQAKDARPSSRPAAAVAPSAAAHPRTFEPDRQSYLQEAAALAAADHPKTFQVDRKAYLKDFQTWDTYRHYNIRLGLDFKGLDVNGRVLGKADFLKRLATSQFVAFKTGLQGDVPTYQLHPLSPAQTEIGNSMQQLARSELTRYKREGQPLPAFTFTDLSGKNYTPANTKGKILVLKCWYINCVACVQEFPAVNQVVEDYRNQPEVLFVSLAFDSKDKLAAFLRKWDLRYAVVPAAREYLEKQLQIHEFPTHLLIGPTGKMVKVTTSIADLLPALRQQVQALHTTAKPGNNSPRSYAAERPSSRTVR